MPISMAVNRERTVGLRTPAGWSAAGLALVVGAGYAAVSAYWAVGGTALLATVGGVFERAGRSGGAGVAALLSLVVAIKLIAAALPLLALGTQAGCRWHRVVWALAWIDAAVLTAYGLLQTSAGLLVQANVIPASADADHRALTWHTYLWDPWFLVWGLLASAALLLGHLRAGHHDVVAETPPARALGERPR